MQTFPRLKTGAAAQLGSIRQVSYRTEVLWYIDGTEQRMTSGAAEIEWQLKFDHLDEQEVTSLSDFFAYWHSSPSGFQFHDPWTDTLVEGCHFAQDEFLVEWLEPNRAATSIRIRRKGPV